MSAKATRWVEVPGNRIKRFKYRKRKRWYKAPKAHRKILECKFRSFVKRLITHLRFDELPNTRRKDADCNWN